MVVNQAFNIATEAPPHGPQVSLACLVCPFHVVQPPTFGIMSYYVSPFTPELGYKKQPRNGPVFDIA